MTQRQSVVWDTANRLAPVLLLVWGIPVILYLTLTKLGQAEDLMRATSEDLTHHFFLTMSLAGFTVAGWFMLATSLRNAEGLTDWAKVALITFFSLVGPAIIVLAYPGVTTFGGILLVVPGVLGPAGYLAFYAVYSQRKGYEVDRLMTMMRVVFATLALAVYGIVFAWPDFWGLWIGPVALLLVVSGTATWVIWFTATRAPAVGLLLVLLAAIAVLTGRFGERPVRTMKGDTTRLSSHAYAREWLAKNPGGRPLFITSDGGGIRSAYWTATVLGALTHDVPTFTRQVYVASGVSGGSAGIAEFAAFPDEREAREALSRDFLAPSLARLLTRDPWDSIVCYGWGWRVFCSGSDRQVSAELNFEAASARLSLPITEGLPFAVALNATDADTGDRLVASNIAIGGAEDLLARLPKGQTLRLSTAMLLSARFPVISPVGQLNLDGKSTRIVDGGYFDNSGGETALEMLRELLSAALEARVKPIGIVITNDPVRARGRFCKAPAEPSPQDGRAITDLLVTPIGTLDATRQKVSEWHRHEFEGAITAAGGSFYELPLFRCEGDPEFPLGWSLSEAVRAHMDDRLKQLRNDNGGPYGDFVRAMRAQGDTEHDIEGHRVAPGL